MFFKALKHDFKSTGRIMGIVYIVVACIIGATLASHYIKRTPELSVSEIIGSFMLLPVVIGLFVLTAVVILVDFHKTLYGDQGYLTFTLPVKSWKILLSKIVTSTIWLFTALVTLFGCIATIYKVFQDELGEDNIESFSDLMEAFFGINIRASIVAIIARIVLLFLMFSFFVLSIFFTSTIANTRLLQKHNVLWTILLLIPIIIVSRILVNFINEHVVFTLYYVDGKVKLVTDYLVDLHYQITLQLHGVQLGEIFVYIVLGAGLFFATHFIMSKKVNIK